MWPPILLLTGIQRETKIRSIRREEQGEGDWGKDEGYEGWQVKLGSDASKPLHRLYGGKKWIKWIGIARKWSVDFLNLLKKLFYTVFAPPGTFRPSFIVFSDDNKKLNFSLSLRLILVNSLTSCTSTLPLSLSQLFSEMSGSDLIFHPAMFDHVSDEKDNLVADFSLDKKEDVRWSNKVVKTCVL